MYVYIEKAHARLLMYVCVCVCVCVCIRRCGGAGLLGALEVTSFNSRSGGGASGSMAVTITYNTTSKLAASVLQKVWLIVRCSVLQCVAVCCSVLQCVELCCTVLHCAALWCTVLHCAALCFTVLHCAALCS